jgi:alpha-glucosidase
LSVTNGVKPTRFKIPLTFLDSGTYQALVLSDDQQQSGALKTSDATHKKGNVLEIALGEGGGYMARFTPVK